jgi:hypothetical protein
VRSHKHCGTCRGLGHSTKTCKRESPPTETKEIISRKLAQAKRENIEWLQRTPARVYSDDNEKHELDKPPFYSHIFVWLGSIKKWLPAIRMVF